MSQMSIVIKEFVNVSEFIKSLDDALAEYRKKLGEMLRKIEELRIRSEQERKLKSVLAKLGMTETPPPSNEITLRNVKIIINPSPSQELSALETAVDSLNNRITMLTAVRKEAEVLGGLDVGLKIVVVYVDDLPKTIMLKLS